jgi:phosphoglycolate phosphatase-like HAD superfamily hydrolase
MNNSRRKVARAIFMDCDGIIFDSNPAKAEVFRIALAAYPKTEVARLESWLASQGGISRYVLLERFFTEIHIFADVKAALKRALVDFGEASVAAYRNLQPLPEALQFAEAMGGAESVTVVSGSDQEELRSVFDDHGISNRFRDVLGSPTTKPVHMERVMAELGAEEGVMIGDGRADFDAARALNLDFVFLAQYSDWVTAELDLKDAPRTRIVHTWQELLAEDGPRQAGVSTYRGKGQD